MSPQSRCTSQESAGRVQRRRGDRRGRRRKARRGGRNHWDGKSPCGGNSKTPRHPPSVRMSNMATAPSLRRGRGRRGHDVRGARRHLALQVDDLQLRLTERLLQHADLLSAALALISSRAYGSGAFLLLRKSNRAAKACCHRGRQQQDQRRRQTHQPNNSFHGQAAFVEHAGAVDAHRQAGEARRRRQRVHRDPAVHRHPADWT